MAGSYYKLTISVICLSAWLVSPGAGAADKVKFSSPKPSSSIETLPTPTLDGLIPEKRDTLGNANVNVRPPAPPALNTNVRGQNTRDVEQENWIFRDTQSASGIQRALGVEVYEDNPSESDPQTSAGVIEEYFSRRNNFRAEELAPGNSDSDPLDRLRPGDTSSRFSESQQVINRGFSSPNTTSQNRFSVGNSRTGFSRTLNSQKPSTRSYYRELYKNQIAPRNPIAPALTSQNPAEEPSEPGGRTRELYNRATFIEGMTPKGPASVFDQVQSTRQKAADEPTRPAPKPFVLERRGGKTVIPSRPL